MTSAFRHIAQALALVMLFSAAQIVSLQSAYAQRAEFDIFDQSDFDTLIASGKPVIVHLNTSW